MAILGAILLIVGLVLGIKLLLIIGLILLVVGLVLFLPYGPQRRRLY